MRNALQWGSRDFSRCSYWQSGEVLVILHLALRNSSRKGDMGSFFACTCRNSYCWEDLMSKLMRGPEQEIPRPFLSKRQEGVGDGVVKVRSQGWAKGMRGQGGVRWEQGSECFYDSQETKGGNCQKENFCGWRDTFLWVCVRGTFSQWSIGTGTSEGLCSLCPWRVSRSDWIKPWAIWSGLMAGDPAWRRMLEQRPPKVSPTVNCHTIQCVLSTGKEKTLEAPLSSLLKFCFSRCDPTQNTCALFAFMIFKTYTMFNWRKVAFWNS